MQYHRSWTIAACVVLSITCKLSAQEPVAHYDFNDSVENIGTGNGACIVNDKIEFEQESVCMNGIYPVGNPEGSEVKCGVPELNYEKFSVVFRFKAKEFEVQIKENEFTVRKSVLVATGPLYRTFELGRAQSGNLKIRLNNGEWEKGFRNAPIETDRWTTVACSVNFPRHEIHAAIDGKYVGKEHLPKELAKLF